MDETAQTQESPPDESLLDTTPYGSGKDDSISDVTENSAITQHTLAINGTSIPYTARAGHLVATDLYSARPAAEIFYVVFTANVVTSSSCSIAFFYNGDPGSSSVFLLLGSFKPRRIRTSMPYFTPPAPYALGDNQDSLLDHADLAFINPVGIGYSAAIAPGKNGDFWGVDEDARSIKQFIKHYLTVFNRWNSLKFLFRESHVTPRTCVRTWLLHEGGVDLNGVALQSSILDYSQMSNPVILFFQTILNFENMSLSGLHARSNLTIPSYPSDHMIYLHNESRSAMKADLAAFYKGSGVHPLAVATGDRLRKLGALSIYAIADVSAAHPTEPTTGLCR